MKSLALRTARQLPLPVKKTLRKLLTQAGIQLPRSRAASDVTNRDQQRPDKAGMASRSRIHAGLINLENAKVDALQRIANSGFANVIEPILFRHILNSIDVSSKGEVAYCLSQLCFQKGDYKGAALYASQMHSALGGKLSPALKRYWAFCLIADGSSTYEEILKILRGDNSADADFFRSFLNSQNAIERINKRYLAAGISPLRLIDSELSASLSNLDAEPRQNVYGPKISVLMPAFNRSDTIIYAAKSILNQTWENIELIIVDDASTDGGSTWAAIQAISELDSRVVALQHEVNQGAYAARNTALKAATGEFVTVQDTDDWSHPQRLEIQMKETALTGEFNLSRAIRVSHTMQPSITSDGRCIVTNYSSAIFDRLKLLSIGGWANVRVAGDDELVSRYEKVFGQKKKVVQPRLPLALILADVQSLTANVKTGKRSINFGARRELVDAYRLWQEGISDSADARLEGTDLPFATPNICRLDRTETVNLDVLYVSDFTLPGGTNASNLEMWRAGRSLGLRQGAFHWPRINNAGRPKNVKVVSAFNDGLVTPVVAGERVKCKLLIVNHPNVLNYMPDALPEVVADAGIIVANQAPYTREVEGKIAYDPAHVALNFGRAFGLDPLWAPLSPLIRRLLREKDGSLKFTAEDWTPLIDPPLWRRDPAGPSDRLPVLGRHGRDATDKWPDDVETIVSAYCIGKPVLFSALGGIEIPKKILGCQPKEWTSHTFDSLHPREFLAQLDFFVYFPQSSMYEAFGRAPMEAMATGMPVILPIKFREIFGDGAIYVEPADVYSTICALWDNPAEYVKQVQRGWDYIDRVCSSANFQSRLAAARDRQFADPPLEESQERVTRPTIGAKLIYSGPA